MSASLMDENFAALRAQHYNATVSHLRLIHEQLFVIRVRPDAGVPNYEAGQYTTLGLGCWEPGVKVVPAEPGAESATPHLIKRPYSIAHPLLDDSGRVTPPRDLDYLEFYITLVNEEQIRHTSFTPRLFKLVEGDRLFCGAKVTGHYTMHNVSETDDIVLFSTGTGEAPHNTMAAELLSRGHRGKIVNVCCVRYAKDLAYTAVHRRVEERFPQYRYLTLTTREPANLDPRAPGYVGKCRLQDLLHNGQLDAALGHPLDPARTHVFLCGNPAMIGAPKKTPTGEKVYTAEGGMVELLEQRGFQVDERKSPGNLHFERYW